MDIINCSHGGLSYPEGILGITMKNVAEKKAGLKRNTSTSQKEHKDDTVARSSNVVNYCGFIDFCTPPAFLHSYP